MSSQSLLTDARDLLDNLKPPVYLVDGLIEEMSTGAIIGASGSCKTFLVIDLGGCITTGIDFCNCPTKQGQVVYMAGEGRQGLARRLKAWEQKYKISILPNQFILSNKTITLDANGAETLMQAISEMSLENVKLLIIDTLARHMDGEENSNTAMSKFITVVDDIRDRLRCSVLIIHHTGHGNESQKRARGASSFYAALDFELLVRKKQGRYSVVGTKSKDGPEWDECLFNLETIDIQGMFDANGIQVTSAVVDWKGKAAIKSSSSRSKAETNALNEFHAALDASGTNQQVNGSNVQSIELERWRKHYYETSTLDNDGSKRAIFNRQKNTLLDAGLIEESNGVFILVNETKQNRNNNVTKFRTLSET